MLMNILFKLGLSFGQKEYRIFIFYIQIWCSFILAVIVLRLAVTCWQIFSVFYSFCINNVYAFKWWNRRELNIWITFINFVQVLWNGEDKIKILKFGMISVKFIYKTVLYVTVVKIHCTENKGKTFSILRHC
jgi:hypothetical protein